MEVLQAGLIPYAEALEWQRALAQARIDGRLGTDLLLLLEHPAVVTLGRTSDAGHLLRRDGIEVFETERGGDVTFHGPGQLVGYPIIDLSRLKPDLHWYLRTLEQALDRGARQARYTRRTERRLHGRLDPWPKNREHRDPREAMGHVARVRAERHD